MSGFDGRISFEGDTDVCKSFLGVSIKHANKQRQTKNILGIRSSTKTYNLGGGASCTVVDLAHMRALHIVAPVFTAFSYEPPEEVEGEDQGPGVYDIVSGFTDIPTIVTEYVSDIGSGSALAAPVPIDVLSKFTPTHRAAERHPSDLNRRQRLAVKENPIFTPISSGDDTNVYSEHAHVKPSNYSGLMGAVVQLIMGIGKILRPTAEEAMGLPPLPPTGVNIFTKKIVDMVSGFGLYGHEAAYTPRVDFDYRVSKTHGISMDDEGVAWVIEIGMRGVIAMRLYMDPVSQTKEGIKRWADVNPELVPFLTFFGGIPLGITVPTFDLFDKYVRAGECVVLISEMDMRTFYSKSPMSSDTGWAFSPMGWSAHNTCHEWGLDFVRTGYYYQISIDVQYERFKPWTPYRAQLASLFATVFEINKCQRMGEDDAKGILAIFAKDVQAGADAFDKFVVKPTLVANAKMSLQKTGRLYNPANFEFQPQIKFPELLVGGLLSYDFSDAGDSPDSVRRTFHKVKCDTPMYVCYIDGNLEVINYAYDSTNLPNPGPPTYETTRQQCQYIGSWVNTTYDAPFPMVQGCFYSNRWDFRREQIMGTKTVDTYHSTRVTAWPMWGQDHPFSINITTWTVVDFFIEHISRRYPDPPEFDISCTAVMYDRNAYYFATVDGQPPPSATYYAGNNEEVRAAQTDWWEVYHFVLAWVGPSDCAKPWIDPSPLDCTARRRCIKVDPNACLSDNLHKDFWLNACKPAGSPPNWQAPFEANPAFNPDVHLPSSYGYAGPTEEGTIDSFVHFVNDTPYGETIVKELHETYVHGSSMSEWWWRASPDESGALAVIESVHSCLGESVTNMMDDMDGDLKHLGGPEYMFAIWNACYTGMIEDD